MKFSFLLLLCAAFLSPTGSFASEKALLKKYPKLFTRSGAKLSLHVEGRNEPVVFTDVAEEGDNYKEAKLFAYFPKKNIAVLQNFYGEGGDYTLFSLKTGTVVIVAEKPLWNKRGDLFVSVNEGEYADDKQGLQFGFCDGKECKLLLEKDGRYSKAKWVSADRLQATNRVPSADGGEGLVLRVRCTFQRKTQQVTCVP